MLLYFNLNKPLPMKHIEVEDSKHPIFDDLKPVSNKKGIRLTAITNPEIEVVLVVKSDCDEDYFDSDEGLYLNPEKYQTKAREELNQKLSSDVVHVKKVAEFVQKKGFTLVEANPVEQQVVIKGSLDKIKAFFKVDVKHFHVGEEKMIGHQGNYCIPEEINHEVEYVLGLSRIPIRRNVPPGDSDSASENVTPKVVNGVDGYTGADFAKLYNFPEEFDGTGECIAIMALEGGYREEEMDQYFSDMGIQPKPTIVPVEVGVSNNPGQKGGENLADVEVCLDIQVAAAAAPGAKIVVYFVEASDYGLLRGIKKAVHDEVHKPSVISISLGNYERHYSGEMLKEYNRVFRYAAQHGITVLCSAGNYGATNYNSTSGFKGLSPMLGLNVQFPASSPYTLSVGGTTLSIEDGKIVDEKVWNAPYFFQSPWSDNPRRIPMGSMSTGGGFSSLFKLSPMVKERVQGDMSGMWPEYRGIPDVCAAADPGVNGYYIYCDGAKFITGGTSAATPLWAALTARLFQGLGKRIFLPPVLYRIIDLKYRDDTYNPKGLKLVTKGNNIVSNSLGQMGYLARQKGWSPCAGLGSPNGLELLNDIKTLPKVIAMEDLQFPAEKVQLNA